MEENNIGQVSKEEVLQYVRDHSLFMMFVSAKTGENITKLFEDICHKMDKLFFKDDNENEKSSKNNDGNNVTHNELRNSMNNRIDVKDKKKCC